MKDEKKLLVEYVKTLENDILINQYDNKDDKQKDVDNLMKSIDRLNKMNELESLEKEKKVNQKIEEDKLKLEKEKLDLEKDKLEQYISIGYINGIKKIIEISSLVWRIFRIMKDPSIIIMYKETIKIKNYDTEHF